MYKICLNMIVKNESKVIKRLLESVLPIIDSYCICDTGSTDDTIEIIETFFKNNKIPGKIVVEPFKDFGYNRTFALKQCSNNTDPNITDLTNLADYLLLLDADMVLTIDSAVNINKLKTSLLQDAYYIYQGSETFFYKNVRILKNNPEFSYWGVTHEFVKVSSNSIYGNIDKDDIFINDIGDGGSKTEKYERDIKLLLKGLEEVPNNERYTFYLANSYKDSGQFESAIEYYEKRIELGGWKEEIWFSYYSVGICFKELGDMPLAIYNWLEGYQFYQDRIENLYEIVTHYRKTNKHALAYTFYEIADYERKRSKTIDHLFLQKDVYDYKLDYELSILGYYYNINNHDVPKSCMKVISNILVDESMCKNVISNYKFYTPKLLDYANKNDNNINLLYKIGDSINIDRNEYISSTPSVCVDTNSIISKQLVISLRYVNYRIDENGGYINKDRISTKNIIAIIDIESSVWRKTNEFELKYDETYDNKYVGLEDIRLFSKNGNLYFNANRGLSTNNIVIETGTINLKSQRTTSTIITKKTNENQRPIEKNWVSFKDYKNEIKMVYEWYPLTVGIQQEPNNNHININKMDKPIKFSTELNITHKIETPSFFKWLRGSTNGINIGDEIWFICHLVSYENRRYYYHIIVILDSKTYEVKRYSKLFTFEKTKIEYTLGFVYFEKDKQFLIGYSLMDRESKYIMVPKIKIDELFV